VSHSHGSAYVVVVPSDRVTLYRLAQGERPDAAQFVSNEKLDKPRLWDSQGEDTAIHRGTRDFVPC
jgi:hypothetical protein